MKSSLCYVYLFELLHSKDKAFACSCINALDALTPAIAGLFFMFIELDVFPLYVLTITGSTIAFLTVIFANMETPMWLLLNGQSAKAIRMFNRIAWFNGVDYRIPDDTEFIEAKQSQIAKAHRKESTV